MGNQAAHTPDTFALSIKKTVVMENAIVITPKVISRMRGMSKEEQKMLIETLLCDEILKTERPSELSPVQELVYVLMRDSIMRDSARYQKAMTQVCTA